MLNTLPHVGHTQRCHRPFTELHQSLMQCAMLVASTQAYEYIVIQHWHCRWTLVLPPVGTVGAFINQHG